MEPLKRLTILMIEVEQPEGLTARKLVAETMKHNVITAYSGQEGLDLFRRNSVDVLLVHSRTSGMRLEDVIASARQQRPEVPVLVVLASDDDHVTAEDLGADATIRPHHVEDLVAFLNRVSMEILHSRPDEQPSTEVHLRQN